MNHLLMVLFSLWLWTLADLNRSPFPCHGNALPDELRARAFFQLRDYTVKNYLKQERCIWMIIETSVYFT